MVVGGGAGPRATLVAKQESLSIITSLIPTSSAKIRPVSTAIASISRAPRERNFFACQILMITPTLSHQQVI